MTCKSPKIEHIETRAAVWRHVQKWLHHKAEMNHGGWGDKYALYAKIIGRYMTGNEPREELIRIPWEVQVASWLRDNCDLQEAVEKEVGVSAAVAESARILREAMAKGEID
jgi:hypothetical protein